MPDKLPDELGLNWTKTPALPQRLLAQKEHSTRIIKWF